MVTRKRAGRQNPLLFLNIGWMARYEGLANDRIRGGGAYVQKHKSGGEVFNFARLRGRYYGYVQPPRFGALHLSKIVPGHAGSSVYPVDVVWTASRPSGGTFIVGWYRNATVFAEYQEPPSRSRRNVRKGEAPMGYNVSAPTGVLLEPDARTFSIPRRKGYLGQSNVWYADRGALRAFRDRAREYMRRVEAGEEMPPITRTGRSRQLDIETRLKVERIAIQVTTKQYVRWGYSVEPVERLNLGWDLEATSRGTSLKLEVKGLQASGVAIELTPNEYSAFRAHAKDYRLCVVTGALLKPRLHIFEWDPKKRRWASQDDLVAKVRPRTGASVAVE